MAESFVCGAIYGGGVTYPRKWQKNFGICEKVRVESNNISEPEIMK